MYRVVEMFRDLADNGHVYEAGDAYPRAGHKPAKERVSELSGNKNRRGRPLIEKVPEKKSAAKK